MKKQIVFIALFVLAFSLFSFNVFALSNNAYNVTFGCNVTDDTYVMGVHNNWNFGTENYTYHNFSLTNQKSSRSYWKFGNCSNQVREWYDNTTMRIVNVTFRTYMNVNRDSTYSIFLVNNSSWVETQLTWNDQPCGSNETNVTSPCGSALNETKFWIPTYVNLYLTGTEDTILNYVNTSIMIANLTDQVNVGYNNLTTKEYAFYTGAGYTPQLIFHFGAIPPTPSNTTTTCSTSDQLLIPIVITMFVIFIVFGVGAVFLKSKNPWVLVPMSLIMILFIVLTPIIIASLNSIC